MATDESLLEIIIDLRSELDPDGTPLYTFRNIADLMHGMGISISADQVMYLHRRWRDQVASESDNDADKAHIKNSSPMPADGVRVQCSCGYTATAPDVPLCCPYCRVRLSHGPNTLSSNVTIFVPAHELLD